jgi:hypothetical protein
MNCNWYKTISQEKNMIKIEMSSSASLAPLIIELFYPTFCIFICYKSEKKAKYKLVEPCYMQGSNPDGLITFSIKTKNH